MFIDVSSERNAASASQKCLFYGNACLCRPIGSGAGKNTGEKTITSAAPKMKEKARPFLPWHIGK